MQRQLITSILLLIFAASSFATPVGEKLSQKLQQFNSLSAKFIETVYSSDGTLLQRSKGSLKILRPGKFRWQQQSPLKQLIVSNGNKIWVYEPDLSQVTVRELNKSLEQTPLLMLSNKNYPLEKHFSVRLKKTNQYALTPNKKSTAFKKIIIRFTQDKISSLQLTNELNQRTIIKFNRVIINPRLSDSLFSFKPPKGVDVVSMAQ